MLSEDKFLFVQMNLIQKELDESNKGNQTFLNESFIREKSSHDKESLIIEVIPLAQNIWIFDLLLIFELSVFLTILQTDRASFIK